MKNLTKIICLAFLGLLFVASPAGASTVEGTLSTGIDAGIGGIVIVAPVATPVSGTYAEKQDVVLTATGATSIHYTFDGTTPTCSSLTYYVGVPIPVSESMTIKALSCYANGKQSAVATFNYTINIPPVTPPVTPPSGGGGGGGGGVSIATPATTPIVGDADSNGKVDIIDFATMMANWGKTGANSSDLNNDLKVDIIDFALLMANWSI